MLKFFTPFVIFHAILAADREISVLHVNKIQSKLIITIVNAQGDTLSHKFLLSNAQNVTHLV